MNFFLYPHRPRRLRSSVMAVAVALACLASSAQAMRIGPAEVRSSLGQTLDLVVPISGDGDPSFQAECARVLRDAGSEGIPGPGATQIVVEPRGTDYVVRIRTSHPVFDPAIKLVLEIGCSQRLRRQFVLLIDPPLGRDGEGARTLAGAPVEPALVLGEAAVMSGRGEPLRMRVPISGRDAAGLDAACVAVTTKPGGSATALLRRNGDATSLLISTAAAVTAAQIGVSVQAGCGQPVVRDYPLLLASPVLAQTEADRTPARTGLTAGVTRKPAPVRVPVAEPLAAPPKPARPASGGDRLMLAEPEEAVAPATTDSKGLNEREQAIHAQLEALVKETAQLRVELAAVQARNNELMSRQQAVAVVDSSEPSVAWIFAALAASVLGLGLLWAWRRRQPIGGGWADDQSPLVGPATRLGVSPVRSVLKADPEVVATASASLTTRAKSTRVAGAQGETELHDEQGRAIQVTEFANTGQLIEDLYSGYLGEADSARPLPSAVPTSVSVETLAPLDIDLGSSPESAPLTQTQLVVDLDLSVPMPDDRVNHNDLALFDTDKISTKASTGTLTPLDFELNFDLPNPPPAPGAKR